MGVVTVEVKGAVYAQSLVAELKEAGLVVHTDFKWAYYPGQSDGWTDDTPPYVVIIFFDKALASFYRLKWL